MASDIKHCASYIWNLDDSSLKDVIECKPKQHQTGETFSIESTSATLPFTLEIYPNGDTDTNNGSFMMYCTLLSVPDHYKRIISNLRLYCKETNTSFTSIATFTSQRNSAGWAPETLMLNELKPLNNANIGCSIDILKIIGTNDDIIYKYKSTETLSVNKKPYSFQWDIDSERFINCRCGKSFESDIFDNLFCLRLCPNGKRIIDEGNVKLYLILCGAIPNIDDNIHISYTLWCNETNTGYNGSIVMNYEYNSIGWPNNILFTKDIKGHKQLTFHAEIEVIPDGANIDTKDDNDDNSSTYSSSSSMDAIKGIYIEDEAVTVAKETHDEDERKEIKRKHIHKHHKNKKKLSVNEFKAVSLEDIMDNNMALDNYDIAKKICKFYDSQFDDTDTVCVVAEKDHQPAISYWVKGGYMRKHMDVNGKHILVYRSIRHSDAQKPILSRKEFEKYVKDISIKHENDSVDVIAQILDSKLGEGCHYARSKAGAKYDIYSRFSDKYECTIKLSSGAYAIAWRR